MQVSRRTLLGAAAAAAATVASVGNAGNTTAARDSDAGRKPDLKPITSGAQPISATERGERIAKVQGLMRDRKIAALLLDSGSSLEYFTGVRWHLSERVTAGVIPAQGQPVIVTPYFEEPSIREMFQIPGDVRPWKEDQNPFELIARTISERAGKGPLAVDAYARYFVIDQVTKAGDGKREVIPGAPLVRACRMVKSPAELALLQIANDVTIAALRYVHGHIELGMKMAEIERMMGDATRALGGGYDFSLVLLNEASAYPHGSRQPQQVRQGSVILMDCGCTVHGYQSDISRTWVFGQPTARQRQVWDLVKRGQEVALETAKIGTPVGAIDTAVRTLYEKEGWSKDYGLPGLSHRTGHGIGLDGHENPYLVRNDPTPLAAGMCFSDEPGIYIPGEFGVRLEDCWHMTDSGPRLFTPLAKSLEDPV